MCVSSSMNRNLFTGVPQLHMVLYGWSWADFISTPIASEKVLLCKTHLILAASLRVLFSKNCRLKYSYVSTIYRGFFIIFLSHVGS